MTRRHPDGHCQHCGEALTFVPCQNCRAAAREEMVNDE